MHRCLFGKDTTNIRNDDCPSWIHDRWFAVWREDSSLQDSGGRVNGLRGTSKPLTFHTYVSFESRQTLLSLFREQCFRA